MEFLGKLGIDVKLLIAQMINFGLLLWLLSRFVYRPILKRIEEDEGKLKQAQHQTEKLERAKARFDQKKKEDIADARKRAREVIGEAEEIAEKIKRQAREEAMKEKRAVTRQIRARLTEIENEQDSK
jgi:F-type H+-transporting ATPase subunit b